MKKIGFYGYFYDFSIDYDAIAVDDILYVHMGQNRVKHKQEI